MGVEQEGVEPSSKQGSNVLSTRLVRCWFSCEGLGTDRPPAPYPLKNFVQRREATAGLSPILLHRLVVRLGKNGLRDDVLFPRLAEE